jgi:ribonuclease HII
VEKGLNKRGFHPIIGSDESGTGSIAGPVIAASCCILTEDWSDYIPIDGVDDSKAVSPEERERIYEEVVSQPDVYNWEIAYRSNQEIDDVNILMATMECFKESIEKVTERLPEDHQAYSIVDGQKTPKLAVKVPCRPWVKGDAEVYTVALASILAKVSIDRLAAEWHATYPEYGFDVHKGYATRDHIEAIHRYGPCPLHRLSFKSLKGR